MTIGRLFNLARMTTATTGTGTLTLGSAVSGYLSFSGAGVPDGAIVSYGIIDGSSSEVGTGTYTSSGTTLSRTVIASTNSGSAINLSGSAEVFITALANNILPAQTTAVQMILNSMANARVAGVAHYGGMSFADSFGATTYVDVAGATALDTTTGGLLKNTVSAESMISAGTGSTIGTLTDNGGLAAIFNGTTSANATNSGTKSSAGTSDYGYAGKNYSGVGGKRISKAVVYGSTDYGYLGTAGNVTIALYGKASSPASATDGTLLATTTFADTAATNSKTLTSSDSATTWNYVWIAISSNSYPETFVLTEAEFWTPGSGNNLTVASNSIALASVPATIIPVIRIKHVDSATAGTDYNLYVSRDGGTTYSSAASLTDWVTDPFETNVHIVYGAPVDVSGQPSGSNLRIKIITSNNKSLEVRDWGAAAYQ